MGEVAPVARLIRRNGCLVQSAFTFLDMENLAKTRPFQKLAHIAEIKRRSVLASAEQKVRKTSAEGVQLTWVVVEPAALLLHVGGNRSLKIWNDDARHHQA
jgi:hypothetical protein